MRLAQEVGNKTTNAFSVKRYSTTGMFTILNPGLCGDACRMENGLRKISIRPLGADLLSKECLAISLVGDARYSGLDRPDGRRKQFYCEIGSVFSVPNTVKVGTYGRMIHEMTEMMMIDMGSMPMEISLFII